MLELFFLRGDWKGNRFFLMGWRPLLQLIVVLLLISQALAITDPADLAALEDLASGWTRNTLNWNGNDPCGTGWKGVQCATAGFNVTSLNLEDTQLQGTLRASIGSLVHLTTLVLAYNPGLSGPIPKEIGKLVNLEYLSLQSCSFNGNIPAELGSLSKLKFLGLNSNKLIGNIPPQIGGLASCTWFDLSENSLSGDLPVSTGAAGIGLDNLTAALHFHMNNNSITGNIPAEISRLPNLIHLLVDSNSMSGRLPNEIGSFKSLTIIRVDNNGFLGPIPDLKNLNKTLNEVHLRNNNFSSFPDFSSLTSLLSLSLGLNRFTPSNLSSITALTSLQTLEIDNGNLIGSVPDSLLALPSIETISLKSNNLNGSLNLGRVSPSLISMDLDNNNIRDLSIPLATPSTFNVSLINNPVCQAGNTPSYVDCTQASSETWIPDSNCTLRLSSCPDKQQVNPALCSCGIPFPLTFQFNAPTFSTMNMQRQTALREQLARVAGVNILQVWVTNVNFTDNFRFYGLVLFFAPQGSVELPDVTKSFILNRFLLHLDDLVGFDPYHVYPGPLDLNVNGKSSKGLKTGVIAGITIALLLVLVAAGYAGFQKLRADKARQATNPFASWGGGKDDGRAPVVKGVRFFTFAELKKATQNFDKSHEVGVGGYGKVYKGHLSTGEVVAIKRAQAGSMQGAHEFKTEIELLSRLHHRNLVGLVGFCYEHGEQMLVYEYMINGTIRDHLVDHSKVLSWNKRLEIAVGSARGLSYLHDLANPPIIHRDIKSSNILLDDMFIAKVADLGLSKVSLADEGKTHVSTQVKGTLGYLDPEYYMTQKLTDKSDVYSFGVVLLELLTARAPIEDGKYIVREIKNALARNGLDSVIPLLDSSLEGYSTHDLKRYLSLALACVEEAADKRPNMNEVVKELEAILSSKSLSSSNSRGAFHAIHLYDDPGTLNSGPFEYSGGYTLPNRVEPK